MKIGSIDIDRPLALAPMDDITSTPFRLICKRLGVDLLYTEFTSSEALIRDARKALHKILVTDEERPIAIQIVGAREEAMREAAAVAESAHPDFIDINAGCWVSNHASRGEGSGLLKDIRKFEKIVRAVVRGTRLPVTVKTRLGWDTRSINITEVARMCETAGAKTLCVHCRTRMQGFDGKADWSWLPKIRQAIKIPLIGNGDVETVNDVKTLYDLGCDGVMIGRGAIKNPWIFRQAKEFLQSGAAPRSIDLTEKIQLCINHLELSIRFHGQRCGINDFKKHYAGYLRELPGVAKFRSRLMQMKDIESIVEQLKNFKKIHPCG